MQKVRWLVVAGCLILGGCSSSEPQSPMPPSARSEADSAKKGWAEVSEDRVAKDGYGRKFGVFIGVTDYEHLGDVNYGVDDALSLQALLESDYGYDRDLALLLTDRDATRARISQAFTDWLPDQRPGPNDAVLVFFSGHGAIQDEGGFIAPADADAGDINDTWISVAQLVEALDQLSTNRSIILDCCYSGSLFQQRGETQLRSPISFVGLSAGRDTPTAQPAFPGMKQQSWFTVRLCDLLKRRAGSERPNQMFAFSELAVQLERMRSDDEPRPDWGTLRDGSRDFYFHPTYVIFPPMHELMELILIDVAPELWGDLGGPGHMQALGSQLTVSAPRSLHQDLQIYLTHLRAARGLKERPIPPAPPEPERVRKLRHSLEEACTIEFNEAPLQEVAKVIGDLHGIPVIVDIEGLREWGLDDSVPFTISVEKVPLSSTLKLLLAQEGMTYLVREEGLVLTTEEVAEFDEPLETRVYELLDLAESIAAEEKREPVLNSAL